MSLLRQLFGPSRREVWEKLSEEIGGQLEEGGFWKGDRVLARAGQWTITLDTYTVSTGKTSTSYTRIRAPYVNKDGFRFTIYRRGFFSDLGKLLGIQDLEIGDPKLDAQMILQANNEQKLRQLLSNGRIRQLILAQPAMHLTVVDDEGWFGAEFPEGVDELRFTTVGVIKELQRLKSLYELFGETLHHLCHIGSAYEEDPQLSL